MSFNGNVREGLTFDDVLLVPHKSDVVPNEVCLKTRAKGLTLSENAKIKAMPNLFIDEYDVIAAHAASIGSISKDDLFYLMSRGLTLEEASKLIVLGFVQPLLDKIDNKELREEIKQNFEEKLS